MQPCLAGDHVAVFGGWHQQHAALQRQALANGFTVFGYGVVGQHLGAVFARGGHLGCGGVVGHEHQGRHVQQARGQCDGLGMVACGKSDDTALALVFVQLGQGIEGSPKLEGARALQVFAFEEQLCAQHFIDGVGAQHRRAVRDALELVGRFHHVVGGGCNQVGQGGHGSVLRRRRYAIGAS